ncbi:type II toxin-antitoxin system HicA family toxin [Methanospirillum sp. J.3.6.1-F.2.7.3]|uniref:Type II toxin-antitoxin system HicA family toxin n=1 Tax=Methanospirillum purgamenti TaxID=2834276 RepID=A0A8E7EJZ3_9EURY|nr:MULTISPECIES: type II toxin-antitoxin system HicA family toxin [Methanospirillum]MDX8551838.1 type II toxin-antitoxin system HicA family toxin [Methanospirillum hungatei]QVV89146.1 type II toxin-antitoxin system HicA family toxin [Methanospirillum sp. J.3.6.1-F.2.7.3]
MTKRLLPVSGMDMERVFSKVGFVFIRQKGSHIVLSRGEEILIVPHHSPVEKGTERDLFKESGLIIEEFNRLL